MGAQNRDITAITIGITISEYNSGEYIILYNSIPVNERQGSSDIVVCFAKQAAYRRNPCKYKYFAFRTVSFYFFPLLRFLVATRKG